MKHHPGYIRRTAALLLAFLLLPILPAVSGAESGVLTLPKNLTSVGREAFRGDTTIQKVVLQEGVRRIYAGAFADSSLREISLPASLEYISETAFRNTPLTTVTAPVGSYAYNWAREHKYITEYRALLIGEKTFLSSESYFIDGTEYTNYYTTNVLRNANDTVKMQAMLDKVCGPEGRDFQTTRRINAGYDSIKAWIRKTFKDTMEQDVSVFFIASHGDNAHDGELLMPFTGDPDSAADRAAYEANKYLSFVTLAEWLSEMVNGKVVVILESCGAGSAIYTANGAKAGLRAEEDRSEYVVKAAVKAFAKADPGIETAAPPADMGRKSTGDLRLPKFYVLAAAAHHEESWGSANSASDPTNLFTRWLIQGVGEKGNSPADVNPADSILTLDELYRYIKKIGDGYKIKVAYTDADGSIQYKYVYQHVQVYPENSDQAIFVLK